MGLRCGKGGRAMLAPTMKLQKSDILFYASLNLLLVGACMAGPPRVRGVTFGVSRPGKGGCSVWVQGETQGPAGGTRGRSQAPPLLYNRKGWGRFCVGLQCNALLTSNSQLLIQKNCPAGQNSEFLRTPGRAGNCGSLEGERPERSAHP